MLSLDQVLAQLLAAVRPLTQIEEVDTSAALGRVLAQPLLSLIDVPPHDNAQMDGYAVRSADIAAAPCTLPVPLRVAAGQLAPPLPARSAARIFTGAPLPAGCDAVVMQENTQAGTGEVTILQVPPPGQWIRRRGSDLAAGATALAAGQALRPQHLGIAASVGAARLQVVRRPQVALFCTGDELAMPGEPAAPGRIYNSNRYLLAGLLESLGCRVQDLGIVPDRLAATRAALAQAAGTADLIVSSGGVSVGDEDHVKAALASLGRLDTWQIAMKPGKPLAFGRVGEVPFIGLPGNPVSSFVTFVLLVRPFLLRSMGIASVRPRAQRLRADFSWKGDAQRREFLRVRRNDRGGLDLYPSQNAALLTSLAWADGLVDLPAGQAVTPGDSLAFLALSDLTGPP